MKFPSSGKKFPDERKNFPFSGKKIPSERNQFPKYGNWFPIKWEISHFVGREEFFSGKKNFLKENSMIDGNLFLLGRNEFPTSRKIFPALREFWENCMENFPSIFLKENGLGVFPGPCCYIFF